MLIPQPDRKKIFEHLFEDGVCIAKKDYNLKSHPEIKGVRNLYVIKALKSLTSQGYVKEQFAWRHYYFFLKPEGIVYLRQKLGLPEDVFPVTYKQRPGVDQGVRPIGDKTPRTTGTKVDERSGYRTTEEKVTEAGPGSGQMMGARGGFGRGGAPQPE